MLVADPPSPCATSWTCAGPNATASEASSRGGRSAGRPGPGTARPGSPRPRRTTPTTRRGHASRCPGRVPRPAATHRTSGPVQGQVPAHIGVPDDQIRPQAGACRQAGRDRPQLTWRKTPGWRDQAAQHLSDGLLALGADTPAGLQPRAGLPSLRDAGTAWCASDSRHAPLPGNSCHHISPAAMGAARSRAGSSRQQGGNPGITKPHPLDAREGGFDLYGQPPVRSHGIGRSDRTIWTGRWCPTASWHARRSADTSMGREPGGIESVAQETA